MIRRLTEAVHDPDPAAHRCGGAEHGKRKSLLVHNLRAGEGEYDTARSHLGNCGGIEPLVCTEGILQHSPMLCKSRRVYNHKVIFSLFAATEELDGIRAMGSMLGEAVQSHIAIHHSHSPGR